LVGDRPQDDAEEDQELTTNKKITIFNKTFNLFHLIVGIVGTLALIAIGVSIAAIGTSQSIGLPDIPSIVC
jgi:hypothetical protein